MNDRDPAATDAWPRSVAILGMGTMGLGVAEYLAAAGVAVRIFDATPELTDQARERLIRRAQTHVDAGLLQPSVVDRVSEVGTARNIPEAVDGVELVFEAVTESLEVKREIFGEISAAAPREAVVASNTSSFPMDELAPSVEHPERFLGMHWFNPPEWTPGIEIIPATATASEVVERTRTFLRRVGKRPAVVGSGPGFVANRLQMALFREAAACVEEGLAAPEELDEVVRSCFGFRLPFFGPFQIADMAGLDVYHSVFETLEQGLGEYFQPPEMLKKSVEQGRVGTKGGAGFYSYSEWETQDLILERDRRYAALNDLLSRLQPYGAEKKVEEEGE